MELEVLKYYLQAAYMLFMIGTSIITGYSICRWNDDRKRKKAKERNFKDEPKLIFLDADK